MQDLNDFYYFVKTVEHGGFAPASRALGLPKSKLSRRIAGLEERLGVTLIYRSTRQFNVTEIGQTFLTHCKAMLIEADAAQEAFEFTRAEPCGTIRLTCPIALLHVHIGQALADFMVKYPKVNIHLEASNRRVDVVAEGVDVAIRVRPAPLENTDLILRVLSERGLCLMASPALIKQYGQPTHPIELSKWPSLGLGEPQHHYAWTLFGPEAEEVSVPHHPRYVTTDMIALRNAALRGVGVVQLPSLMVTEQIKDGSLVHILPQWQPKRDIIHLVYPSRRGMLPAVRALVDYLVQYYNSFDEE
ncbi:MAG: LysR family transcriptional regulator [Gammaproteobacteria bacterium]|nr:LysR family transcriptional regulator [Gammaproteobacteria bacterium]